MGIVFPHGNPAAFVNRKVSKKQGFEHIAGRAKRPEQPRENTPTQQGKKKQPNKTTGRWEEQSKQSYIYIYIYKLLHSRGHPHSY